MKHKGILWSAALVASALVAPSVASAAQIAGVVLGGGAPIAGSEVSLWQASAEAPKRLSDGLTGADGRFSLVAPDSVTKGTSLYIVATGGTPIGSTENSHIGLMTVLGGQLPPSVTVNEMTTIASVWTHNQFIEGSAIRAQPLQLAIAAGNVPSFVDLATGGWGSTIQDPLNSGQTPTMANFATLANLLSGCVKDVVDGACEALFAASVGPDGKMPTDTLTAAAAIARGPGMSPNAASSCLIRSIPCPRTSRCGRSPTCPT